MIRTQIQLTKQQKAALRQLASAEGVSLAELIRRAVDGLIARSPIPAEQTRARALAAVGSFESGHQDVSRRHDEHIAEAFHR
jgi:hypothetical protein